jgi:hypothetical protein
MGSSDWNIVFNVNTWTDTRVHSIQEHKAFVLLRG